MIYRSTLFSIFNYFQVFQGNSDSGSIQKHIIYPPLFTFEMRIKVESFNGDYACLRVEVYGCPDGEYYLRRFIWHLSSATRLDANIRKENDQLRKIIQTSEQLTEVSATYLYQETEIEG